MLAHPRERCMKFSGVLPAEPISLFHSAPAPITSYCNVGPTHTRQRFSTPSVRRCPSQQAAIRPFSASRASLGLTIGCFPGNDATLEVCLHERFFLCYIQLSFFRLSFCLKFTSSEANSPVIIFSLFCHLGTHMQTL